MSRESIKNAATTFFLSIGKDVKPPNPAPRYTIAPLGRLDATVPYLRHYRDGKYSGTIPGFPGDELPGTNLAYDSGSGAPGKAFRKQLNALIAKAQADTNQGGDPYDGGVVYLNSAIDTEQATSWHNVQYNIRLPPGRQEKTQVLECIWILYHGKSEVHQATLFIDSAVVEGMIGVGVLADPADNEHARDTWYGGLGPETAESRAETSAAVTKYEYREDCEVAGSVRPTENGIVPVGEEGPVWAAGQRVMWRYHDEEKHYGVVRFVGETDFVPGQWVGVELDQPNGYSNGFCQGKQYFTCADKHGIWARPGSLQDEQAAREDDDASSYTDEFEETYKKRSELEAEHKNRTRGNVGTNNKPNDMDEEKSRSVVDDDHQTDVSDGARFTPSEITASSLQSLDRTMAALYELALEHTRYAGLNVKVAEHIITSAPHMKMGYRSDGDEADEPELDSPVSIRAGRYPYDGVHYNPEWDSPESPRVPYDEEHAKGVIQAFADQRKKNGLPRLDKLSNDRAEKTAVDPVAETPESPMPVWTGSLTSATSQTAKIAHDT